MRIASNDFANLKNSPPIKQQIIQSLHWWREDDIVWEHERMGGTNFFTLERLKNF